MSGLRIAIVGAGVIGKIHADTIAGLGSDASVVLAVDGNADRAKELHERWTSSYAEALASEDVDAVAICTPSGTHADLVVAALDAGKHVIVEKPLDVSLDAAHRVAEAQARSDRTVAVVSQHRFDPASEVVHNAVATGAFGRITSGVASLAWWRSQGYYDSGEWRGTWALDGGGALMNQGIHTVDLMIWLLGEPVEVYAATATLSHERIEVEDTAVATVRFASGALGLIHATTAAYPGISARLQVHGDRGSAVIENDQLAFFHAAGDEAGSDYGIVGSGNQAADVLPPAAPAVAGAAGLLSQTHVVQYRDFVEAVRDKRPPLVGVPEATTTLSVILAVYESARTGLPVKLG
ncbi:MAG: UDP-N-acetyl-2-amino-2-deoxyglucuronate dehydrogenase [Frankiales bacterium]|nr:UDP-N-acetyl-2-amino-2-deoxyglucuronate dehydrogenase [Frankiales bacterium]